MSNVIIQVNNDNNIKSEEQIEEFIYDHITTESQSSTWFKIVECKTPLASCNFASLDIARSIVQTRRWHPTGHFH